MLNTLYTKVLQYDLPIENNLHNDILRSQSYKAHNKTRLDLSLPHENKKNKGFRPNYFGLELKQPMNKSFKKIVISPKVIEKQKIGDF